MSKIIFIIFLLLANPCFAAIDMSGDAADYITCGDVTFLNGATSFRVRIVMDLDVLPATEENLFGKWDADEYTFAVFIKSSGEFCACYTSDNWGSNYSCECSGAASISAAAGIQVVEVDWLGGTDWEFYLNGQDAGNTGADDWDVPGAFPDNTDVLVFGENTAYSESPNGQIYQIDVDNASGTATSALNYYNAKLKSFGEMSGDIFSLWLDDHPIGLSVNNTVFKDRVSGTSCTGVDADSNSLTIGEKIFNYPQGIVQ